MTILTAGTCTIAANQAGASSTTRRRPVTRTFTVKRAAQAISTIPMGITPRADIRCRRTGTFAVVRDGVGRDGHVRVWAGGDLHGERSSNATAVMKSGGICTIAANQAGNTNYLAAPQVTQSVTIGKASQTITFAGPGNQTFRTAPITLTATATSGLTVAFAATGNCTVSGSTLTLTAAGSCTITASQAGDDELRPGSAGRAHDHDRPLGSRQRVDVAHGQDDDAAPVPHGDALRVGDRSPDRC